MSFVVQDSDRYQTGTLDDTKILDNFQVNAELYANNRPKWVGAQEGAAQKASMS